MPFSCETLVYAWFPGGYWRKDPTTDLDVPSGELSSTISIVHSGNGSIYPVRATALSEFSIAVQHSAPEPPCPICLRR